MNRQSMSSIRSTPPKRIVSFYNSINDIIKKFEHSSDSHNQHGRSENCMLKSKKTNKRKLINDFNVNICSKIHANREFKVKNETPNLNGMKMVDSISEDVFEDSVQSDCDQPENTSIDTSESYDSIENISELNVYEYVPLESAINARPTKLSSFQNINVVRSQLNIVQRLVGLLLSVPFFASVNGAGLSTLTCAFFLPRFLCEHLLYPIFRLILGTLYPAYASYKAVRNKDVHDYVSDHFIS